MICKYVFTDNTNPHENLALEELLMDIVEPDTYVLDLWQNAHTVQVTIGL